MASTAEKPVDVGWKVKSLVMFLRVIGVLWILADVIASFMMGDFLDDDSLLKLLLGPLFFMAFIVALPGVWVFQKAGEILNRVRTSLTADKTGPPIVG